jgi:predicted transglutaminase-like cysteine proteinase
MRETDRSFEMASMKPARAPWAQAALKVWRYVCVPINAPLLLIMICAVVACAAFPPTVGTQPAGGLSALSGLAAGGAAEADAKKPSVAAHVSSRQAAAGEAQAEMHGAHAAVSAHAVRSVEYTWESFDGLSWKYTLHIPDVLYESYKGVSRKDMDGYTAYITDTSDDALISDIVGSFLAAIEKKGYDADSAVDFIVSFVQSLEYVPDSIATGYDEYPKYPLETLYDMGGDCEDTSILLASLLLEMGYSAVLIGLADDDDSKNHMGVGIKGVSTLPGNYFTHSGSRYYYTETSEKGWKVGELPPELHGMEPIVMAF